MHLHINFSPPPPPPQSSLLPINCPTVKYILKTIQVGLGWGMGGSYYASYYTYQRPELETN